jgi:co-chaperonin GroES (HSP10)
MHLRPLHDRIIVQRLEDSQRTGARLPLDVKPGDDVLAIQERSL